jgi:hypothetical protein
MCECGNTWNGKATSLRTGNTTSCGCTNSRGELIIKTTLTSLNVSFRHNQTLGDCADIKRLRFDFILYDDTFCIEYHGKQHYLPTCGFGESFEDITRRDQIKRDYCAANGITLIEIPYTYFDQLEELITELVETGAMRPLVHPKIEEPTHG